MTKRDRLAIEQKRELQRAGFDIQGKRRVRFHANAELETTRHFMAKAVAGHTLAAVGYRVDSEVELEKGSKPSEHPIADIIGYGLEDRQPVVVELDTECDSGVKRENLRTYMADPISEVYTVDVTSLPSDVQGMREDIAGVLGLEG